MDGCQGSTRPSTPSGMLPNPDSSNVHEQPGTTPAAQSSISPLDNGRMEEDHSGVIKPRPRPLEFGPQGISASDEPQEQVASRVQAPEHVSANILLYNNQTSPRLNSRRLERHPKKRLGHRLAST